MNVLQRLAHARALERLEPGQQRSSPGPVPSVPGVPSDSAGPATPASSAGADAPFDWRELSVSLQPAANRPRGFGERRSQRPPSLGGCLDRLELPGASELARDLVCLGAAQGSRAVFIDTETTGLGSASVPFVVGVAWHEGASLRVGQWTLSRLGGEAELLADLLAKLRTLGADPLVSFNGASFDLPLLRLRARRYGLCDRILDVDHVDLLHPARRMQRGRSQDCRLSTLERDLLALCRRGDIDSAEIPAVFWAWLRAPADLRAQRRLRAVCEHNLVDLVTLPALAARLAHDIREPGDLDRARRSVRHLIKFGAEDQARMLLARWVEAGLEAGLTGGLEAGLTGGLTGGLTAGPDPGRDPRWREAALELAQLERRAGARERAATLWQAAWRGDPGCPAASEAWAKHLEHHAGNFGEALRVARASRLPCPRRIARLERRLSRQRSSAATLSAASPESLPIRDPAPPRSPQARGEASEARGEAPQARGGASEARGEAPQARGEASEARGEAPQARSGASQARGGPVQLRGEASEARGEAPQLRGEASEARGEAPQARGGASQARGEPAQLRGEASEARGEPAQLREEASQARGEAPQLRGEASQARSDPAQLCSGRLQARGEAPAARGGLPPARGEAPAAHCGLTEARGEAPAARGGLPPARGEAPAARGGLPEARGEAPQARPGRPQARSEPPEVVRSASFQARGEAPQARPGRPQARSEPPEVVRAAAPQPRSERPQPRPEAAPRAALGVPRPELLSVVEDDSGARRRYRLLR
ncbi:Chromosome partition protein Smc [Enhygromyxa salina]|uniref:Chromosome partition protein Smc n=1 Tax=Enhygromyxa salina TaxID=215803 RepID=A0A2S9YAW0_9BACT|nr:ribonuclease H-like domain-containing protein [Enhygromyxa salina]PRQ02239.1 Chromosome partition protein Smc [Enhygromyxa salina]